ncbi:MAG TPA: hydroxysqualene dehydroxylase HpnE [Candidatus Acidoferrum sp.]|nr:hydroxysqualene dehydroxylase HpnE [Candidatus Acidoferrum sp.]
MKSAIVIGGGLAGLACGVALAEAGWRVRLFEQKPFLGGRATSYVLPNGEHVDNCQHVTLGCCTNLADFYGRVGSADKIKFFDELVFLDPQGRRGTMKAGFLPAPFHMTGSFLTFAPLTIRDKFSIARVMLDIVVAKGKTADLAEPRPISMLEWLCRRRQTKGAIERFWRVVLVSALDEELERTDARYGVDVFWKAFLMNSTGYRMGVPTVPLADLYVGCKAAIESRGGEVSLRSPVRSLRAEGTSIKAVQFDAGKEESADAYVFAVAHDALFDLMPESIRRAEPSLANLSKIKTAPITGVHFWFDRPVMDEPFVTLLDTNTQWIFNKTMLYGEQTGTANNREQYLQMVVSASYELLKKSRQEIIDLCLREVRQALPRAQAAQLMKSTVIKEVAATFSPQPGVDRWRPQQQTTIPSLFFAGDWTATGWPATMEGAVRSGYLAAEAVLHASASLPAFGTAHQFLQPDLPPSGLISLIVPKQKPK